MNDSESTPRRAATCKFGNACGFVDIFISFRLISAQIIDLISSLTTEAALQIPLPPYHEPTVSFLSERSESLSLWQQVQILSYSSRRVSRPIYKCLIPKEPTFGTTKPSRRVISPPGCMFILLEDRKVQARIRV
jgi:hypothetical protein